MFNQNLIFNSTTVTFIIFISLYFAVPPRAVWFKQMCCTLQQLSSCWNPNLDPAWCCCSRILAGESHRYKLRIWSTVTFFVGFHAAENAWHFRELFFESSWRFFSYERKGMILLLLIILSIYMYPICIKFWPKYILY